MGNCISYISSLLISHFELLLSILQGLRVFIKLVLCPLQLLLHLQKFIFMLMEEINTETAGQQYHIQNVFIRSFADMLNTVIVILWNIDTL